VPADAGRGGRGCGGCGGPDERGGRGGRRTAQGRGERLRAGEPVRGQLLQRNGQCCRDVLRHGLAILRHGRGLLRDDLHYDLLRGAADVRRLAGQHLVQHAGQRVDVAARADLLLCRRLLGTHVVRRAETQARLRHPPARRRTHCQRDAEVRHHGATLVQQDVLRLDVAMDDAVAVRVVEGVSHAHGHADRLVHTQLRLAVEPAAQRLAPDERHHVEQEAGGSAGVEERQDVGVLKRRRRPDLMDEAVRTQHSGQLGLEHLDGDAAFVLQVVGKVHRRHAALAELAVYAVAVSQRVAQLLDILLGAHATPSPGG
jgi:hypothetical protein